MNLQPLNSLFQTINPTELILPHPLIFLSNVRPSSSSELTICVAYSSSLFPPSSSDSTTTPTDKYWSKTLNEEEFNQFITVEGAALTGDRLISRLRETIVDGRLRVEGLTEKALKKSSTAAAVDIKVEFTITTSLKLYLTLSPSPTSPFSLVYLLSKIIPTHLASSIATSKANEATAALTSLRRDFAKVSGEKDRAKEDVKRLKKSGSNNTGGGSKGEGGSTQSGSGSGSGKTPVDGVSKKKEEAAPKRNLQPGMRGYAGGGVVGIIKRDTGFESASDSD